MKKKLFLVLSMIMMLGLAAAAFAHNQSVNATRSSMDCCKSKDSCPMKNKDAAGKTESCCDDVNCCCKSGDSCLMKKEETKSTGEMGSMEQGTASGDKKSCDCSCCKKA